MSKLKDLKTEYKAAQKAYYAGKPIMTDAKFERLEEKIIALEPDWDGFDKPNETVTKKAKIKLTQPMPSLGKCYPHQVDKWIAKQKKAKLYWMDKLDGSSVKATYVNRKPVQLVTRGKGEVGQDISFLIPHTNLPKKIKSKERVELRIEAIMPMEVWARKYSGESENPRNLVAGILNRKLTKSSTQQLQHIDFVVLGVYGHEVEAGLEFAKEQGFATVNGGRLSKPDSESLVKLLGERRKISQYEIDGLVLAPVFETFEYVNADKPKWTTAFKQNLDEDEAPEAEVLDVIWQISHNKRWTPKIEIEPTRIDGVTIRFTTVHNYAWMAKHKIGKGAIIKIVRSGGVIPKVVGVVKSAKQVALPPGGYERRGVHLWATEHNVESEIKAIARFLTVCGVEGIKTKSVERMYENGVTDIYKLLRIASASNDIQIRAMGFGPKQSVLMYAELQKLRLITFEQALIGTCVFEQGIGERILAKIAKAYPLGKLMEWKKAEYTYYLEKLDGFGGATIAALWTGMKKYRSVHERLTERIQVFVPKTKTKVKEVAKGRLKGMKASWTGYRSKDEEREWEELGGEVVAFSSKTEVLFYKADGKFMGKVDKAYERGVKTTLWTEKENQQWW